MRVQVKTHDTETGRIPDRIRFDGRSVDIVEVLDQWHGAEERYFKLRGGDGHLYMLRFDEPKNRWDLTLYQDQRVEESEVPLPEHEAPAWKHEAGLAASRPRRLH
jgi:hypothetical protein